jgi:isopenicillin-N N-acyltransferase-like protein
VIIHSCVTDIQDPQSRGRQIGERWAEEIRHTVSLYLDFFPRVGIDPQRVRVLGEASLSALEAWCPDLASEVAAVAAGAGLPVWQLASLNAPRRESAQRPCMHRPVRANPERFKPGTGMTPSLPTALCCN